MTQAVLSEWRWCCDVLASRGVAANGVLVADDENLDIAREFGFEAFEHPNDRGLGAKFNAGYSYALRQGADYVIHIGSDDWVHPDFFEPLPLPDRPLLALPLVPGEVIVSSLSHTVMTGNRVTIVDMTTGQAHIHTATRNYGVIPWALPAKVFTKYDMMDPTIDVGAEMELVRSLYPVNWERSCPNPFTCVDFKIPAVNLTSYVRCEEIGENVPDIWAALPEYYPTHLVDQMHNLHEELAWQPELRQRSLTRS